MKYQELSPDGTRSATPYATSMAHIDGMGCTSVVYFNGDTIAHFNMSAGTEREAYELGTLMTLIRDTNTEAELLQAAGENGFSVCRFVLDPSYDTDTLSRLEA